MCLISVLQLSTILILTSLLITLNPIGCTTNFDPPDIEWDFPSEEIFEIGKQSIDSQHASKLRLKSSELYLPQNVVPRSYKLKIRPILESLNPEEIFTSPGSVQIHIICLKETDSIVLHAHSIKIIETSVQVEIKSNEPNSSRDSKFISVIGHTLDKPETDFYKLTLSERLTPGFQYVIYIEFISKISTNSLNGLYLSNYTDPLTHEKKHLAVTQFEDISARKMFPNFDEPALKATFEITISHLAKYNSMSNMALKFTEPDPDCEGYFLDHYPPTPLMSTYLVALVVSEFSCTAAPISLYNKSVEACGPKHMIDNFGGTHAAQLSARILNYYDKLWLKPYPLPKMQSVAIPDFDAGAMENYGLNTYRIGALMYYAGVTTESQRHSIELTIAHELAHQNFGNLVTCKTWNHIFLNEGFATFVSYFGMKEVSPEFESDLSWYTGYFQLALKSDADSKTHPIVKTEDYFGDFDRISYSKGASIIKMMENILTQEALIGGLRQYLDTLYFNHDSSFGNTHYSNLFATLETHSHTNKTHPELATMTEIMETWTIQPGFPLIRVSWSSQKTFTVSQEKFQKFTFHAKTESNETTPVLWHCPIFIATSEESGIERPSLWLTNKEVTKSWITKSTVDWIIVNVNSAAFFRVLYDGKLTTAIQYQLDTNANVFSPITKAMLIDDSFECAWARYNPINVALSRTKFLGTETDASVWSTALSHLKKIGQMLEDDEVSFADFKNYMAPRISSSLALIGVEQLPQDKGKIVMHRESLIGYGGSLEVSSILEYASDLVDQWMNMPTLNPIPVDIQGQIYCTAILAGTRETFEFLFDQYLLVESETQKRLLVSSFGCSKDIETLQRLLENATSPASGFTKNDGYLLIHKLADNVLSRLATYWYIRNDFNRIAQHFESVGAISSILARISRFWNTEDKLNLISEFVNEFSEQLQPVMSSVNSTIVSVKENIEWMDFHGKSIKLWFAEQEQTKMT